MTFTEIFNRYPFVNTLIKLNHNLNSTLVLNNKPVLCVERVESIFTCFQFKISIHKKYQFIVPSSITTNPIQGMQNPSEYVLYKYLIRLVM